MLIYTANMSKLKPWFDNGSTSGAPSRAYMFHGVNRPCMCRIRHVRLCIQSGKYIFFYQHLSVSIRNRTKQMPHDRGMGDHGDGLPQHSFYYLNFPCVTLPNVVLCTDNNTRLFGYRRNNHNLLSQVKWKTNKHPVLLLEPCLGCFSRFKKM